MILQWLSERLDEYRSDSFVDGFEDEFYYKEYTLPAERQAREGFKKIRLCWLKENRSDACLTITYLNNSKKTFTIIDDYTQDIIDYLNKEIKYQPVHRTL